MPALQAIPRTICLSNSLLLLVSSATIFTAYYIYIRYLSVLSKIPGPLEAIVSRGWLAYHSHRGDMHLVMPDLHAKYGKVVRTAPNEVSISDVSAIREIYGPGSKYRKSDWYSVWQGTQKTDLFAERDIATHANLKKNISRVYAMSSLTAMEKYVDDAVVFFMTCMAERSNQAIDLGVWLQLLAFDVIGEVSFSKGFGFLETGDDGTLSKIERALRSLAWVGQVPWVYWLEHHLAPIFGHHLDVKLRHGSIRSYAAREVEARRGRQSEHDDILSHLFKVSAEGKIDDHAVISIATANIFAGSDTTAISLRAIVYNLIRNPDCLRRLRDELQERKINGRLQFPAKFSQVSDWPYLQACISEALRLHPAVGMALPRVVPEGGRTLAGIFLPEGVREVQTNLKRSELTYLRPW